jgi:prolycopene isomerase
LELPDGTTVPSNIMISNADARLTFSVLIGQKHLPGRFLRKLSNMVPSLSMIVIYMGIDPSAGQLPDRGVNLWYLPHYDLDSLYCKARANHAETVFMLRVGPDKNSIVAFAQASFLNLDYWRENKEKLLDHYVSGIERCIVPGLSKRLLYREAATPATLYRYTLNSQGASYGWDATVEQLADSDFYRPSFVQGLYLVGHWTTQGLGITGAIYTARERARLLLRGAKRKRL